VSELVSVARAEDVPPGTVTAVEAAGEPVALVNLDGTFYALQGKCLHLEGPLGEGHIELECYLTCPWHGWKYHVRTGKNDFDLAIEARTYDVTVEDGEVKVAV
jgi:nitrite reductase (NADH) small subunit